MKKQVFSVFLALTISVASFSILSYVSTTQEALDGEVEPFSFQEEFLTSSNPTKPLSAKECNVPIYKKNTAVRLKWAVVKNAKKYKISIKNIKTGKTIYSVTTKNKNLTFPSKKNKASASYLVTVYALNSNGKIIKNYKTIFHTGKVVVDTNTKIDYRYVLYVMDDLKKDLVGVAFNGLLGVIEDDGTLHILDKKLEDMQD